MSLGGGGTVGKNHDVIILVDDFVRSDDKVFLPLFSLGAV